MDKTLIVYFSRSGENYVDGKIVNLEKGNTKVLAKMIHEKIESTVFEVQTIREYAKNYHDCTIEAKKELENNERPKLLDYVHQFKEYKNIILCYPNWWSTMPMAMFTFLEQHQTKGKQIYPVCSHEGSGMANSEQDIRKLCPEATVHPGLAIKGSKVKEAQDKIEKRLETIGGNKNGNY